ncbi:MAG: hypothetical protein LBK73_12330 [Treponema sp.]|jgi:hypothetical protein|nr:hypothetical protein [Treponema sp.]
MKEKQAVGSVPVACKPDGKRVRLSLDEFIRIAGYKNRKRALRVLNKPQAPQAPLAGDGKAVELKPSKKTADRAGKKSTPVRPPLLSVSSGPFSGINAVDPKIRGSRLLLCGGGRAVSPNGRTSASRRAPKPNSRP